MAEPNLWFLCAFFILFLHRIPYLYLQVLLVLSFKKYKAKNTLKYWKTITKYTGFIVLDEKNVQEEQEKSQKEQAKPDEKDESKKATESSKGNKTEEGSKGNNSEK